MQRSIELSGKSESTLTNYSRCLAGLALHFDCSPTELDEEQLQDYLLFVKKQHQTPSESFYKHTIYGLRYAFKICDLKELHIKLPSIEKPKKLPVVLNQTEVKQLIESPTLLKHRLVIALLYGCGLRCSEVRNIQLKDIDFERKSLFVRAGKGRKDRMVVLGELQIKGVKKYLQAERPHKWLFTGNSSSGEIIPLSNRGVQWIVRQARKKCQIQKEVTTHTLRHSYATHLLEMGLDIMTLKDLLGHAEIRSTLVYLHVSRINKQLAFSPLDRLYNYGSQKK
jgi:site-specific recombinase XerD